MVQGSQAWHQVQFSRCMSGNLLGANAEEKNLQLVEVVQFLQTILYRKSLIFEWFPI